MTGVELKQRRLAIGWSVSALAGLMACSASTIRRWERGAKIPDDQARWLEWFLAKKGAIT